MLGYILLAILGMRVDVPWWYWVVLCMGLASKLAFYIVEYDDDCWFEEAEDEG